MGSSDLGVGLSDVKKHLLLPRTMFWGGLSFVVAEGLSFLSSQPSVVPNMYGLELILRGAPSQSVQMVALFVGSAIFAFGFRGGWGIVGSSFVGRVALLLFGLAVPLQIFSSGVVYLSNLYGTGLGFVVGIFFELLPVVAVFVSGVVVIRVHALKGFARWGLVVFAFLQIVVFVLAIVSINLQSSYPEILLYVNVFPSFVLFVWGANMMLYGKLPFIKLRLRAVYDKWRLTT